MPILTAIPIVTKHGCLAEAAIHIPILPSFSLVRSYGIKFMIVKIIKLILEFSTLSRPVITVIRRNIISLAVRIRRILESDS